jgi:hypothetical protein
MSALSCCQRETKDIASAAAAASLSKDNERDQLSSLFFSLFVIATFFVVTRQQRSAVFPGFIAALLDWKWNSFCRKKEGRQDRE